MSIKNNLRIFLKGEDLTEEVLEYKSIDNKFEITFKNGKKFRYNKDNVEIRDLTEQEKKSRDCLKYLIELSKEVGPKVPSKTEGRKSVLSIYYSKLSAISKDGVFANFLKGSLPEKKVDSSDTSEIIYPFGFNESQKSAVENALLNSLSVIEGPPGTGKTQTILNIIANVVMRKETVAVVSSNNSATENVYEKLHKYGLEFLAASLGSKDNKKNFIENQKVRPDVSEWLIDANEQKSLQSKALEKKRLLDINLKKKIKLAKCKQEISEVEVEREHFLEYLTRDFSEEELKVTREFLKSRDALEIWILCENEPRLKGFGLLSETLKDIVGFSSRKLLVHRYRDKFKKETLVDLFQKRFYDLKVQELETEIKKNELALETYNFKEKMDEYTQMSMQLFKAKLSEKFHDLNNAKFELDDLRKKAREFLRHYPVIMSTTYSITGCLDSAIHYDYVIVDEASQVDICTGGLALSCAKNFVAVGDLKQLPHVVDSNDEKVTDKIFSNYNISESYRYKNQSLLSSLISLYPDIPRTLLREHYRCHPKIIDFCNKKFYNNELIIMTDHESDISPLIVYKTIKGNHARGKVNQRQIDVIVEEVIPQQGIDINDGSLGIISPYRNQTRKLEKEFEDYSVKSDTVNKFQGQERDVVILSTVDNNITKFTDDVNRLNVAVSRAVKQLIVVVNNTSTVNDTNIGDLVKYIKYNNLEVVESKVQSVFDYLFKSYSRERNKYLSKYKKVSEFDSENIMNRLILDTLKSKGITNISIVRHIPLRMILRDMDKLSGEEKRFARNHLTHVDFLLFDSLTKRPKLIIEVDGAAFHKEGSRQESRDNMKDGILKKYDLPIVRFRTDGSLEKVKLSKLIEKYCF